MRKVVLAWAAREWELEPFRSRLSGLSRVAAAGRRDVVKGVDTDGGGEIDDAALLE